MVRCTRFTLTLSSPGCNPGRSEGRGVSKGAAGYSAATARPAGQVTPVPPRPQ